jgi:hypothetical protein
MTSLPPSFLFFSYVCKVFGKDSETRMRTHFSVILTSKQVSILFHIPVFLFVHLFDKEREREREMCDSHKRFIYLFCSMAIGIQTSWLVFCLLSIPLKKLTNVKRKKNVFCIYVFMYECVCVFVVLLIYLSEKVCVAWAVKKRQMERLVPT